ncbi:MAG: redox-sensing transcriptional repressor Rex [Spirochaetaceae bacterium]|nr:redox-sensing transcriptional repressor Rex [Spirochaetaceae bacterium]
MIRRKISAAPSVRRLPSYLHVIKQVDTEGSEYISGTVIAGELNLEPIQVRKDLAITGIIGKPKKGYPAKALITAIEHFLGWDEIQDAILVGVGNLGSALMGYPELRSHGLRMVAAFDINPEKIGNPVHGVPVYSVDGMGSTIQDLAVKLALLTVPNTEAQRSADILVGAGITAIWNFTKVKLKVPDEVIVEKEDISSGYAILRVMQQTKKNEKNHGAP